MKIREIRERRGWSQKEVAAEAGIDRGYLSRLERGICGNPSQWAIERIALALEVSPRHIADKRKVWVLK